MDKIIRSKMPDIKRELPGIRFARAKDIKTLRQCYRLLHDAYVASGYTEPNKTGLRFVKQHSDSGTTVLRGYSIKSSTTVYTASIFDKNFPAMQEPLFADEIIKLKLAGRKIVEVGCLAANPLYSKGDMNIPMHMNKMALNYAIHMYKADSVIITINPKHLKIYESILLFEKIGYIEHFGYVKGAPAILMHLDLNTVKNSYKKVYGKKPEGKNLYDFFFSGSCERKFK